MLGSLDILSRCFTDKSLMAEKIENIVWIFSVKASCVSENYGFFLGIYNMIGIFPKNVITHSFGKSLLMKICENLLITFGVTSIRELSN